MTQTPIQKAQPKRRPRETDPKLLHPAPPVELTAEKFKLICAELARHGSKYPACEALGFDYATVRGAIQDAEKRGDDSWREAWEVAYDQWRDSLEAEANRRGRDGVPTEWVTDPVSGDRVVVKREYSDRMLELLMKGHFPERFRDKIFVSGTVGLEPVDAFANLTPKAKREIRAIIMKDLEEQRDLAETVAREKREGLNGPVIEGQVITQAIEDMRLTSAEDAS